jgi:hypothetical protein
MTVAPLARDSLFSMELCVHLVTCDEREYSTPGTEEHPTFAPKQLFRVDVLGKYCCFQIHI